MPSRRDMFFFLAAAAVAGGSAPRALGAPLAAAGQPDLRGAIDAVEYRAIPEGGDRKTRNLQQMIEQAARENVPVFLPPGTYRVANLNLPDNTRITGVAGASRIVYTGEGHLFAAANVRRIELSNLVIDGGNRQLADSAGGLIQFTGVDEVLIENCEIGGSRKHGLQLERCGGRIERSRISGAAQAGLYAVDSANLSVTGNTITDCGNGGILVHRWNKAEDGTVVSGNRISNIRANDGGTGQNGNGINIFRADGVMVVNNHISDCAFTAIRANSASDIQISNNQCRRSGETAIYVEFAFEGAVVSANMIDGAANGISIANFDEGGRLATVTGNVVRNLTLKGPYKHEVGFGIGIAAEADTLISANMIEGAPRWGMQIGWGPYLRNVVVSGNVVRQAPVGCAVSVADGAGTAVITDNVFQETAKGAVLGFQWEKKVSAEMAGGGAPYKQLTVERNRVS
ncbi:TIGR03808 family TAT-translocated repetitive protein [Rhizobium acidisoli]|uniref:TIGR03808 family TAT-translocated repetitive protein n=1 Tax=Rhizobium acidisoli TaxID=1538158 RepID=A0AAE5TTZ3_9HYPH|nr:TIGR03808 family TAT-translocated repetitive protein [Rhizobium acidisoli]KPH10346.1 Tat protein [Rhizobium acidisoli]QAS77339.1 TIGR03808 family TAT-translocated repetitive protein [Rhizobium acidisoli]